MMKKFPGLITTLLFAGIINAQNVGIGTTTPTAKLHVNGTFKMADGTQGAGKILTSDASGMATWQSPPPPAPTYYSAVGMCCQTWMAKNLDVSTYRNGDPIPKVTSNATWSTLTYGAYCYYNNDSATYAAVYGKLYNWYAFMDPRGLAPEGWHIPSPFEWTTLADCLGGEVGAGAVLKEKGITHWTTPNTGATNETNFIGLPAGTRSPNGTFSSIGITGLFWSTKLDPDGTNVWCRQLYYNNANLSQTGYNKNHGLSVRCVKD